VILGHPFHIGGSEQVTHFLNEETRDLFGGSFHVHTDPAEAAAKVLELLRAARQKLGIDKQAARKLVDMKDRREISV
jgi:hydroxylamine reductase (hybrid-cluster protein)